MVLFDKSLLKHDFTDSVTNSNFVLFILLREYISYTKVDEALTSEHQDGNKISLYLYLYKMLKDPPENPFKCLDSGSKILPDRLQALARGRVERLRNYFEVISYTHPNSVKSEVLAEASVLEDDFSVSKESVFGLFLRRFSLGFCQQSFERMVSFLEFFFSNYDNASSNISSDTCSESFIQKKDPIHQISNPSHAFEMSSEILKSVNLLGGRPNCDPQSLKSVLLNCQEMFPELEAPHYASHILSARSRNLTEAERNLQSYFETHMAISGANNNLSTTCAYMAASAAALQQSFGHRSHGKHLEKEALKKALESDSKAPLNYVKISHTLLSFGSEPFRYGGHVSTKDETQPQHVTFVELRTQFWESVNSGIPPSELLALYLNSTVASSSVYFSACLLDWAALWSYYGYPALSTCLMQCVVNADCLQPCPTSDAVLSTAFAHLVKAFNSMGSVKMALQLAKSCQRVLCRFSEVSPLHHASLEVELEQCLRSASDLDHCGRLIKSLRLYCPWEATFRQAELERCRGNISTCHDMLQYIIESALVHLKRSNDIAFNMCLGPSKPTVFHCQPFSHIDIPNLDKQLPITQIPKLVQTTLRTSIYLVELLLSLKLHNRAEQLLNMVESISVQYHLSLGRQTVRLLRLAVATELNQPTIESEQVASLFRSLSIGDLLHRSDRLTCYRWILFTNRIRFRLETAFKQHKEAYRVQFFQIYKEQILEALEFCRKLDDRRRVLDTLVFLAMVLDATGCTEERNVVSRIFKDLLNDGYIPMTNGCSPGSYSVAVL